MKDLQRGGTTLETIQKKYIAGEIRESALLRIRLRRMVNLTEFHEGKMTTRECENCRKPGTTEHFINECVK